MDIFCFKVYYDEIRYGERWRFYDLIDCEIMCFYFIDRLIRLLFIVGFFVNVMV